MPRVTRLLRADDAEELASILLAGRDFFAPWDPIRPEEYFTPEGQTRVVARLLNSHEAGTSVPLVILAPDGSIAGRITIQSIIRGVAQSATLAYWVRQDLCGRGLATAAVADAVKLSFGDLGLHRLQVDVMPHNTASRRVMAKSGFQVFGVAPKYLQIAGTWQDCILYQRLANER